jgi:hypothetical protein
MPIRTACLALCAAALLLPASALAGPPGKWSLISTNTLDNIDQVALSWTHVGLLHAISPHKGAQALTHPANAPGGARGATTPVTSGWATISYVPDLVTQPDGSLRAFFGGIHSTTTGDPNNDYNTATAPASGDPWTLFGGPVVKGDAAYGSDSGVALQSDGTPLISFGGTGTGTFVHRGLDPNTPNFPVKTPSGLCCTYQPDVAVDQGGDAYVAFFSNATGDEGLWVQGLDQNTGQPTGVPVRVPGSSVDFQGKQQSVQQLLRTQIVARPGGGVWIAGSSGYPTANKPYVWKVGTPKQIPIALTKGGDSITVLSADSAGHLWAVWTERVSGTAKVFARRSSAKNPAKFGPFVTLGGPPKMDSIYSLAANAQAGRLDVVGLFGNTAGIGHWHSQVLAGLAIGASPSKVNGKKGSKVKFTITDPDPVNGVKVSGGGDSGTTDANGHTTLTIGPTKKKSVTITVTRAGYTTATKKLKVTH